MTCSLDGDGYLTLMCCTGTAHSSRNDLSAVADALFQSVQVLIIDMLDLILAENANLLAFISDGTVRLGRNFLFHRMNLHFKLERQVVVV